MEIKQILQIVLIIITSLILVTMITFTIFWVIRHPPVQNNTICNDYIHNWEENTVVGEIKNEQVIWCIQEERGTEI